MRSSDSQPAMQPLSTSGSLSAAQVVSTRSRDESFAFEFHGAVSAVVKMGGSAGLRKALARSARLARLCTGRKRSTCGSSARTPAARGSKPSKRSSGLSQTSSCADAVQLRRGVAQVAVVVAVQPVGDQQHGGVGAEHAPRPAAVELVQAGGDARAALPVVHLRVGQLQRDVGVAVLQAARDVGQPRAEGEGVHLQVAPRQAVHVVQEQARVAVHRARDVEQHHQRRRLVARAREGRRQRLRLARHVLQACARRSSVPLARRLVRRRRRPGRTGSGTRSASFFASSNSPVVIVSKSACCRRSRSEKLKVGLEPDLLLRRLVRGFGGARGGAAAPALRRAGSHAAGAPSRRDR